VYGEDTEDKSYKSVGKCDGNGVIKASGTGTYRVDFTLDKTSFNTVLNIAGITSVKASSAVKNGKVYSVYFDMSGYKDTEFTVTGLGGDVKIAVSKAPAEKYFKPQYVEVKDIKTKDLGKGSFTRTAAFNLPETVEANLLYIGEFWVEDGNWASYPPHKHDVDNMPTEGFLDEIYYFEFDKPQGFGFQAVYSKEGDINEVYKVKTGDLVEIPKGYHPFTVAPGYKNYCLWIMAGKDRGIFCTAEEEHKWVNN
jgi:5-deoxy-glucuronate isomerase